MYKSLSTRYHNAKVHNTLEPPFTYTKADGTESVLWPPHVGLGFRV
jgi:hypothetical protein